MELYLGRSKLGRSKLGRNGKDQGDSAPSARPFDLNCSRYSKKILTIAIYCGIKESVIDSMCALGENPG